MLCYTCTMRSACLCCRDKQPRFVFSPMSVLQGTMALSFSCGEYECNRYHQPGPRLSISAATCHPTDAHRRDFPLRPIGTKMLPRKQDMHVDHTDYSDWRPETGTYQPPWHHVWRDEGEDDSITTGGVSVSQITSRRGPTRIRTECDDRSSVRGGGVCHQPCSLQTNASLFLGL